MDLKALKKQESKRKISKGYMWAFFCAIFWGIWYLPGTVVWVLNPFDEMSSAIAKTSGDGISLVVTAVLITAFNALAVMGMGVGGIPMLETPPIDAVTRASKAMVEIAGVDGI